MKRVAFFEKAVAEFYDEDAWAYNLPANKDHEYRGKKGFYFNPETK